MIRDNLKALAKIALSEARVFLSIWRPPFQEDRSDPLDDLEARYAARGEQLQKEREDFAARLEIERDLVKAHKDRGDDFSVGWGMTAQELEAWKLRCLEAEAKLAPLLKKVDRLTRPWKAVQCRGGAGLVDQYNVARERPHDPARGFYSPGVPVLSYDHFLGGGFKKEEAERHAKQLNADLADDSLE